MTRTLRETKGIQGTSTADDQEREATGQRHQEYPVDVRGTERHPSLEAAQREGLLPLAGAVARAVREGLARGTYVVENGSVVRATRANADTRE